MDCEKFESAMMDELYGELDELTSAAAKRHIASCARCAALMGGLRATRRVASLPMVEPPAELEERILTAARDTQKVVPLRRRLGYAISIAGRWAMQPQAAVAVVFFVMLGGSVLLLRPARAPKTAAAPGLMPAVTITEQGAPAPEVAAANAAPVAGAPSGALGDDSALAEARRSRAAPPPASLADPYAAKAKGPELAAGMRGAAALSGAGGGAAGPGALGGGVSTGDLAKNEASTDDLTTARSIRDSKGCRAALAPFDRAAQSGQPTPGRWDALLEAALCRRNVGDLSTARVYLSQLLSVDSHKDRARAELDRIDQQIAQSTNVVAGRAAQVHAAPKAAPAAAPAATQAPATKAAADSASGL
jgi:hypothetical protein